MAQRGSGGTGTENRRQGGRYRWPFGGREATRSNRRLRAHEAIGFGAPLTAAFVAMAYLGGRRAEAGEPEDMLSGQPAAPERTARTDGAAPAPTADGATLLQTAAAAAPVLAPGAIAGAADLLEPRPVDGPAGLRPEGERTMPEAAARGSGPPPDAPPPQAPAVPAGPGPAPVPPEVVAIPEGEEAAAGTPEEDLGPIGRVATAGDADGAIEGTAADDVLRGGEGADVLRGFAGEDRLAGGAGDDLLEGGAGRDALLGEAGNDRLDGGDGNDRLDGGAGDDILEGGEGRDELLGGPGDDILEGGPGIDRLAGGPGDDILAVDHPADVAIEETGPGGGADTLRVEAAYADNLAALRPGAAPDGAATFVVGGTVGRELPEGADGYLQQVRPGIEHVELRGTADHDVVGDDGANRLYGNAGDNGLWGEAGDDLLAGGAGEDLLYGGAGDDLLDGGEGADMLYGGAGDDTYLLGLAEDGPDRIFDTEGVNGLRFEGPADSELAARLDGGDLEILADGQNIATILGYADDPGAWKEIAVGGESRPLASLLGSDGGGEADLLDPFEPAAGATTDSDILAGGEGGDGVGEDAGGGLVGEQRGMGTELPPAADGGLAPTTSAPEDAGGFLGGEDPWLPVDGVPGAVFEEFGQNPEVLAGVRPGDGFPAAKELAAQDG